MLITAVDECCVDSLVISSVVNDGKHITFKGSDMKILFKWRITLFPQEEIEAGTYGYDAVQGTTGDVIGHYIDYNCISSDDENRNIYGLKLRNMDGGLPEDTYMSRLQPLNEVVEALCKNADIGCDIYMTEDNDNYTFDLVPGTDRSNKQSANVFLLICSITRMS